MNYFAHGRNFIDDPCFRLFSRERFLSDYQDDGKLLFRVNQVMRRVGLPRLPAEMADFFAAARPLIAARKSELLAA